MVKKCCGHDCCTSEYCNTKETCSGKCKSTPLVWGEDSVELVIPYFIFDSTKEFAEEVGIDIFGQLYGAYNTNKKDK